MYPALVWDFKGLHKQVHQHRFAAANAAPHVYPLRSSRFSPEELADQSARTVLLELFLQLIQTHCSLSLVDVVASGGIV